MEKATELRKWLCISCGKLLAKLNLIDGKIQIRCRCGTMNEISAKPRQERSPTNTK